MIPVTCGCERTVLRGALYFVTGWCFLYMLFQGTGQLPEKPLESMPYLMVRIGIGVAFVIGLSGLVVSAGPGREYITRPNDRPSRHGDL